MKKKSKIGFIRRLKTVPLPILIVLVVFLLGASAATAMHLHSKSSKPSVPEIKSSDSSKYNPVAESPVTTTEQPKSSTQSTTSTTNQPKPAPQPYTPDPCPDLEKAVADKEYTYLDTANKYISIINKDIHDRYDPNTDTYGDIDTVRSSVAYANNTLDGIYGDVVNKFNYQKSKGCHYSKIIGHFSLPYVGDYPSNWATDAQNALQASWSQ